MAGGTGMSSKTAFWEDGIALELNLSSKQTLCEDGTALEMRLSSKKALCEDGTALRLNSSPKQTPLRTFESEQPTAVNEFQ